MYKKAFIVWNNKMNILNDEYKNRVLPHNNGSVKVSYDCNKCKLHRDIIYNIAKLPLDNIFRTCGIIRHPFPCFNCRGNDIFIPYPINY